MRRGAFDYFDQGWDLGNKILTDVRSAKTKEAAHGMRAAREAIDTAPAQATTEQKWSPIKPGSPIEEVNLSTNWHVDPKYHSAMRESRQKYLDRLTEEDPTKAMLMEEYLDRKDQRDAIDGFQKAARMMATGDPNWTKAALHAYGLVNDGGAAQIRNIGGQYVAVGYDEKTGEYRDAVPLNPKFFEDLSAAVVDPVKWRSLKVQMRRDEAQARESEINVGRMEDPTSPENKARAAAGHAADLQVKYGEQEILSKLKTEEERQNYLRSSAELNSWLGPARALSALGTDTMSTSLSYVFGGGKDGAKAEAAWRKDLDKKVNDYIASFPEDSPQALLAVTGGGPNVVSTAAMHLLSANPEMYKAAPDMVIRDAATASVLELTARGAYGKDADMDEQLNNVQFTTRQAEGKDPGGMYITSKDEGREMFLPVSAAPAFYANRMAYYAEQARTAATPAERAEAASMFEHLGRIVRKAVGAGGEVVKSAISGGGTPAGAIAETARRSGIPEVAEDVYESSKGAASDLFYGMSLDPDDPYWGK